MNLFLTYYLLGGVGVGVGWVGEGRRVKLERVTKTVTSERAGNGKLSTDQIESNHKYSQNSSILITGHCRMYERVCVSVLLWLYLCDSVCLCMRVCGMAQAQGCENTICCMKWNRTDAINIPRMTAIVVTLRLIRKHDLIEYNSFPLLRLSI